MPGSIMPSAWKAVQMAKTEVLYSPLEKYTRNNEYAANPKPYPNCSVKTQAFIIHKEDG